MKPTREEVIRVARECGALANAAGTIQLLYPELERLAQHFYEAGKREFEDKAWKLIDELEKVRSAPDGAEFWGHLNAADDELMAALEQATGEKK